MTLYATYFDSNFLVRGLACLRSIAAHSRQKPRFLVLALDDHCVEALDKLRQEIDENVELRILSLAQMEQEFPQLKLVKAGRSKVEYYFTLTPFFCAEALRSVAENEYAIYVDADLYFYSDPEIALSASDNACVAIVEHRFHGALAHLAALYGRFNVGWNAFRPSPEATACLTRWQQQCIDACSGLEGQASFADQKYLDDWPQTISSLAIVTHPGVNLAPWNVARHRLERAASGEVLVDGLPLVFFHFHRLKRHSSSVYETDYGRFGPIGPVLAGAVYRPYLEALEQIEARVVAVLGAQPGGDHMSSAGRNNWSIRSAVSGALRVGRLLNGRRVIFQHGRVAPPWRSLLHA